MRLRRLPTVVPAALLASLLSGTALAQQGRVSGVVKDDDGSPIKAATILADSQENSRTFTATTDDKGRWVMIGLAPGIWRFIARAPGFTTDALGMRVGSATTVNPAVLFTLHKSGPGAYGPLAGLSNKDLQESLLKAEAAFDASNWDEAIRIYQMMLTRSPVLGVLNLQIGAAYRNKKDFEHAALAYNDLLSTEPNNEKAIVGLAMTHIERGDAAEGHAVLEKAAASPNAGREVFYTLGELAMQSGGCQQAAPWYTKASAADSSWGKPIYQLALCAQKAGDAKSASDFMRKVIDVDPVSSEASLAKAAVDQLNR